MQQHIIDLYDAYTHSIIDRRAFLQRLSQLTGSLASALSLLPLLSANRAHAAVTASDDERISSAYVDIPAADGKSIKGYLVRPVNREKSPAVIVIHENRGLNAHIEDVARRLALDGFLAFAPDFLSGFGGTPADEDQARDLIGKLDSRQTLLDLVAIRAQLAKHPHGTGKVGAVGFCWGGGKVGELAVSDPDLNAGVVYYGRQPDPARVEKINAPLLLHYAGLDTRINEGIAGFEQALAKNHKQYALYIYEGANHAFNNDTSEARYDKQAADLAWSRTIAFFNEKLKA